MPIERQRVEQIGIAVGQTAVGTAEVFVGAIAALVSIAVAVEFAGPLTALALCEGVGMGIGVGVGGWGVVDGQRRIHRAWSAYRESSHRSHSRRK